MPTNAGGRPGGLTRLTYTPMLGHERPPGQPDNSRLLQATTDSSIRSSYCDGCEGVMQVGWRVGYSAENLSRNRRLALNLLRRDKTCKAGIKGTRLQARLKQKYLLRVLSQGIKMRLPW